MKSVSSLAGLFVLLIALLVLTAPHTASSASDLSDQKTSAEIEKLRADTAKAHADAEKARAEAMTARLGPVDKLKAPEGTIDPSNMGLAGTMVAIDLLRNEVVKRLKADLCGSGEKFALRDATLQDKAFAARRTEELLDQYLANLQEHRKKLVDWGRNKRIRPTAADIAGATAIIYALQQIAGLSRSDFKFGLSRVDDAKALLVTFLSNETGCDNFVRFGLGHLGEPDKKRLNELVKKTDRVQDLRAELSGMLARYTEEEKKDPVVAHAIAAVAAAGRFIEALVPDSLESNAPLFVVAQHLRYVEELRGVQQLLDIEVKLDGLSIVKNRWLLGQRLSFTGAVVVNFRLFNRESGKLEKSGVIYGLGQPRGIELHGEAPSEDFFRLRP